MTQHDLNHRKLWLQCSVLRPEGHAPDQSEPRGVRKFPPPPPIWCPVCADSTGVGPQLPAHILVPAGLGFSPWESVQWRCSSNQVAAPEWGEENEKGVKGIPGIILAAEAGHSPLAKGGGGWRAVTAVISVLEKQVECVMQ